MSKILVVANETVGADELLHELRRLEDEKTSDYYVMVPARPLHERHGTVWTQEGAIEAAAERLEQTLEMLRAEGLKADGRVGDMRPLHAINDALMDFKADLIVISTHPERRSRWLAARPRGAGRTALRAAGDPRRVARPPPSRTELPRDGATRPAHRRIALHGEHHAESRRRRALCPHQRANGGRRAPLLRSSRRPTCAGCRPTSWRAVGRGAFGEIVGAFDLADRRGAAPFAVRAFNPSLQSDGYALPGSVLETNTPTRRSWSTRSPPSSTSRGLACASDPPGDRRGARRGRRASTTVLHARETDRARVGDALRARAPPVERGADELADACATSCATSRPPCATSRDARAGAGDGRGGAGGGGRYTADEVDEAVPSSSGCRGQLRLPRLPRVRDRRERGRRSCPAPGSASSPTRLEPLPRADAPDSIEPRSASASPAATCCSSRRRTGSRPCTGARAWTTSASSASAPTARSSARCA